MLRSLSEFLLTNGTGLIARNSRAAEFNQAPPHLSHGVLAGVPRPVEFRQRDGQNPGGKELQQHLGDTQEQRPAPDALARAALIVAQAQFFDLIEVDFYLAAAGIGVDHLHGVKGEVGTEQIPRGEGKWGDGDNHHAREQRAMGPHATQEDFDLTDRDDALAAPHAQDRLLLTQALGEAREQLIEATGLTKQTGTTLARRATVRRKVDALVTAQAPQGKVPLPAERTQQRA